MNFSRHQLQDYRNEEHSPEPPPLRLHPASVLPLPETCIPHRELDEFPLRCQTAPTVQRSLQAAGEAPMAESRKRNLQSGVAGPAAGPAGGDKSDRSEERRVGKECRSRW